MINFLEKLNLKGYTFVIPSVCVGNVGQLTTDLMISTLSMRRIGTVWDPSIIPIIGPPAYAHEIGITTASDLYVSDKHKLVILQLRSPLVSALMGAFFDKLTDFLVKEQFERMIILTATFAHERHIVEGCLFEYQATSSFCDKYSQELERLNIQRNQEDSLHGAGYAGKLQRVSGLKGIPAITLYKYVSEGDNIPDAIQLLECFDRLMSIVPKQDDKGTVELIYPSSWKYLYGNAPPKQIY